MDYLSDYDYFEISKQAGFFLITFILGRLSCRSRSQVSFTKSITELNFRVLKSGENKHYYSYLHYRLKVFFTVLVFFTCLLSFLLYFPLANYEIPRYEVICGSALVSCSTFLISLYSSYKSSEFVHSEQFFKQKLSTIRAEIIKELGPEVIDALRSNECSKKCTEEIQKLNLAIGKYKAFIEKLSKFQWCDGCSQNKKCCSNCGPDFWIYVKDALRGLKT